MPKRAIPLLTLSRAGEAAYANYRTRKVVPLRQGEATPPSKSSHVSLTETFCSRLSPASAIAVHDYYSVGTSGLSLRLTPPSKTHRLGLLTWRYTYRDRGRISRIITIGRYPGWSSDAAHKRATKIRSLLEDGDDPRKAKFTVDENGVHRVIVNFKPELLPVSSESGSIDTVGYLFRQYAAKRLSELSDNHRRNVTQIFNRHVIPELSQRDIKSVTKRELVNLYNTIKDTGHLVAANRFSTTMAAWGRYLVEQGVLEASPAIGMPRTNETERQRFLSLDELVLIWKGTEALGGPRGYFVKWLILTLTRRDEARELPWGEIVDGNYWLLPGVRNKSDRDHPIPLSSLAQAVLTECADIRSGSYVFSVTGKNPISGMSALKRELDAAIAASQEPDVPPLSRWVFHDIRRSVRSEISRLGVSHFVGERLLNHSLPKLSRTYQGYDFRPERAAALEKWANRLGPLVDPAYLPVALDETRVTLDENEVVVDPRVAGG